MYTNNQLSLYQGKHCPCLHMVPVQIDEAPISMFENINETTLVCLCLWRGNIGLNMLYRTFELEVSYYEKLSGTRNSSLQN